MSFAVLPNPKFCSLQSTIMVNISITVEMRAHLPWDGSGGGGGGERV